MGLFDRVSRVVRANITNLVNQAEDPEKILEQTVQDMQENLIQLRQAVAQAIATQKRTERQASQADMTADEWYRRAQLAMQKGDEPLAREALTRRQSYQDTATALKAQIQQQSGVVGKLKENMRTLESKLAEAKTKKDMYIARARSAKASQQLNEMLNRTGNNNAATAFERMEERVLHLEAQAEASAELNQADPIEKQFRSLEGSSNIDAEIAALKAQLSSPAPAQLPAHPSVDEELEQLRSELDNA